MASWMVHFRIADRLLDRIAGLMPVEFVYGNIAPDSGVPNEDWSVYTPSTYVSHFRTTGADGLKEICLEQYTGKYLKKEQYETYTARQKSFYLGYFSHLLTDMEWAEQIVRPSKEKFRKLYEKDRNEWVWTLKKDWYDLDFLFLQNHPDFRAFCLYEKNAGFQNEFMDFFAPDAFENRRQYICGFYREEREGLAREYPYLSEERMDRFVGDCAEKVAKKLQKYAVE